MLRLLSTRVNLFRYSPSPFASRLQYFSSKPSPLAPSAPKYTVAILSDKPILRKLRDQLLPSSRRAIESLPQCARSDGAFLICEGPHGDDMHCTAHVFQGDENDLDGRKYVGGVHFFLDDRRPTFRSNRNNLKWTPRTFESHRERVIILNSESTTSNDSSE